MVSKLLDCKNKLRDKSILLKVNNVFLVTDYWSHLILMLPKLFEILRTLLSFEPPDDSDSMTKGWMILINLGHLLSIASIRNRNGEAICTYYCSDVDNFLCIKGAHRCNQQMEMDFQKLSRKKVKYSRLKTTEIITWNSYNIQPQKRQGRQRQIKLKPCYQAYN